MTALTINIPVIETERLILREPRASDYDAHVDYALSERSRFTGGPFDRFGAWRNFTSAYGHWFLKGFGFWTIEDKSTGSPAGRVGILEPDGWPEPELGWHVYEGFEGKGIAFDAAKASLKAAAQHFDITAPISVVDPDNIRSRRLAERLGAHIEREDTIFNIPVLIYRHSEEDI